MTSGNTSPFSLAGLPCEAPNSPELSEGGAAVQNRGTSRKLSLPTLSSFEDWWTSHDGVFTGLQLPVFPSVQDPLQCAQPPDKL